MSGAQLDHLIVGARELDLAVEWVEERLGVGTRPGGRHPGVGTRNRLLTLDDGAYLEVVGSDPDQPKPARPRWFGLDAVDEPRLLTWCVRVPDLEAAVEAVRAAGLDLGAIQEGSRDRTEGGTLRWRVSDPWAPRAGGAVPFLIDWLDSPHPAAGGGPGIRVVSLTVRHPEPASVRRAMEALELPVSVEEGEAPGLEAVLDTPRGRVRLG